MEAGRHSPLLVTHVRSLAQAWYFTQRLLIVLSSISWSQIFAGLNSNILVLPSSRVSTLPLQATALGQTALLVMTNWAAQPGPKTGFSMLHYSPSSYNVIPHKCNIGCVNRHDKTCYKRESTSVVYGEHIATSAPERICFEKHKTLCIYWIKSKWTSAYQAGQMRRKSSEKHEHEVNQWF